MGDHLQTRITEALRLRERSRAEDYRAANVRADRGLIDANLTCPLGCDGLVFNDPNLRWNHLRTVHLDALSGLDDTFEARRPPSVESVDVEPNSRLQTSTGPITDILAQLSPNKKQTTVSPVSLLRDSRPSPTLSSNSSKRPASHGQPTATAPRHSSQDQNFQAQRRIDTYCQKIRRGLRGFVNNAQTIAIADTGAAANIISATYAKKLQLLINNRPCSFKLGNSQIIRSIGSFR